MVYMNSLITAFLNDYYNNPDPQYAVLLKGRWGCGKTHFIKNWLKKYKKGETTEDAVTITLEPIYISLYGLRTIEEIKTAINREINPFFYSKTGKILKGVAKVIGKVVLKTAIDFNGDGKEDAKFSGSIDSLSLFHSKENVVTGNKFIVFDDIERCQVDIKSLLGFINYFVEHCGCHVIVIGDDRQIIDEQRKNLDDFKEKTIGREFTIGPDTPGAVDYFLSEPHISNYLSVERDYIIKCFNCSGNENLRILRQCLMDFSTQIAEVEESALEGGNLFIHGLLGSFIAVFMEFNSRENRDIFYNYAKFFELAVSGLDGENGKKLRALNQKYNDISQGCIYHALSVEYVHYIVNHITKGSSLIDYIQQHLYDSKKSFASWERLSGFEKLENDTFNTLYKDVVEALKADEIQLPYQMGTTIGYLGYIDATGVKKLTQTNLNHIKSILRKRINAAPDLDSLYQTRVGLIQGINSIRLRVDGSEMTVVKDCVETVENTFVKRQKNLPDEMQIALRTLSESNVYQLSDIDDKAYPDRSSTYQLRAIFEHEDAALLFEKICGLSNKGKNYFCSFLSKHYMFGVSLQNYGGVYAPDKKFLKRLGKMIKGKLMTAEGVDKLAYKRLDDALVKALKRCEGDDNPLE